MTFSPIFGTGLARSGGLLYSSCLSAHPQIMVACCPNLELFRSYRNAILRDLKNKDFLIECPKDTPLLDWFGTTNRIKILEFMLEYATLDNQFLNEEWESFYNTSVERGKLESEDLTKHYKELRGKTYKNIFSNLLSIIKKSRNCYDKKWIGLHETWIIDFFPSLARSFPDARFLVMLRDPRAIINSMLGIKNIDPSQLVQVLSYIRHWRKYVALASIFIKDPIFKNRLLVTSHDSILNDTKSTLTRICNFLDLELDEKILNTENFTNFSSEATWEGNSSFENKTLGIDPIRSKRWRKMLDPLIIETIEYLCGQELKLIGYPIITEMADPEIDMNSQIFNYLYDNYNAYSNWRSDLKDFEKDIGLELIRRNLLRNNYLCEDEDLIKKLFLSTNTFKELKNPQNKLLPDLEKQLS